MGRQRVVSAGEEKKHSSHQASGTRMPNTRNNKFLEPSVYGRRGLHCCKFRYCWEVSTAVCTMQLVTSLPCYRLRYLEEVCRTVSVLQTGTFYSCINCRWQGHSTVADYRYFQDVSRTVCILLAGTRLLLWSFYSRLYNATGHVTSLLQTPVISRMCQNPSVYCRRPL